jgi:hypothetical protein
MPWINGPLILYHGCDHISATRMTTPVFPNQHGIHLARSRAFTDFGRGFYMTTSLHQATNWANSRCRRRLRTPTPWLATVLSFSVDRNQLAALQTLCFVTEGSNSDYWDLVQHCRGGGIHLLMGHNNYDVVFGPVSLWPQRLVIKDCDQISFHTPRGLFILPTPSILAQGTPGNPLLP